MIEMARRFAGVTVALLLAAARVGAQKPPVSFRATPVADGLYFLSTGDPMHDNVVAFLSREGTLLVDAGYAEEAPALRAALAALGAGPVRWLVDTHAHHAQANAAFPEATIVAHERARERLAQRSMMYGMMELGPYPEPALPRLTVSADATIRIGGETVRLVHHPRAHTDGDLVVVFEKANAAATGDVFVPMLGVCDFAMGCEWQGYLGALIRLRDSLPRDVRLLPGHGPVSRWEDLRDLAELVTEVTPRVQALKASGASLEQLKNEGLPERWRSWGARGLSVEFFLENAWKALP